MNRLEIAGSGFKKVFENRNGNLVAIERSFQTGVIFPGAGLEDVGINRGGEAGSEAVFIIEISVVIGVGSGFADFAVGRTQKLGIPSAGQFDFITFFVNHIGEFYIGVIHHLENIARPGGHRRSHRKNFLYLFRHNMFFLADEIFDHEPINRKFIVIQEFFHFGIFDFQNFGIYVGL